MAEYGQEYFEDIGTSAGVNTLRANTCRLIDFALVVLQDGEAHRFETASREFGIVVLTGTVDVAVGSRVFSGVGGRSSVFAAPPSMVYAPCGAEVTVTASGDAEVALCSAPSESDLEPYLVGPDDVTRGTWGQHNTTRDYAFTIDATRPSERLYVAEVTVSSGNWATYPPHKHEDDAPERGELFQEEMYYYRVSPATGFGFCGLYGGKVGSDYAFVVRDRTMLKMPHGYHVVTAAPGYKVWYLALFAGNSKGAAPQTDPDHAWYHNVETVLGNLRP
ncbi:5-deoxy-glucuronate isomerase [Georgenia alba]|uniref:5-deoxy-glucuronate isomerase n=1 Tax=Georgenia alba TaxID=2233858 RepID=A0ABW2Q626_9MICO